MKAKVSYIIDESSFKTYKSFSFNDINVILGHIIYSV